MTAKRAREESRLYLGNGEMIVVTKREREKEIDRERERHIE